MLKRNTYTRQITSGSLYSLLDYTTQLPLIELKKKIDAWYEQYGDQVFFHYDDGSYLNNEESSWSLCIDELEAETHYKKRVVVYEATKKQRALKDKAKREAKKKARDKKDLKEFIRLQKKFNKES